MNYNNLKSKVEHCLKNYSETRDSDITLFIKIIELFYNKFIFSHHKLNGAFPAIELKDLFELPKQEDVARIRRKLNQEGKYKTTNETIIEGRKMNEEYWYNKMLNDNPSRG